MAYLEPVTIETLPEPSTPPAKSARSSVGAQVGGQIVPHVVLGQDVKKGDLIAEIDSVPQLNQLETDKARLQSMNRSLPPKGNPEDRQNQV